MEKCYSSVDCPKCGDKDFGSLIALKKHLETSCNKMTLICKHCEESVLREDIAKHDCVRALKSLIENKIVKLKKLEVKKWQKY